VTVKCDTPRKERGETLVLMELEEHQVKTVCLDQPEDPVKMDSLG